MTIPPAVGARVVAVGARVVAARTVKFAGLGAVGAVKLAVMTWMGAVAGVPLAG